MPETKGRVPSIAPFVDQKKKKGGVSIFIKIGQHFQALVRGLLLIPALSFACLDSLSPFF